jgi:hypothetical protein
MEARVGAQLGTRLRGKLLVGMCHAYQVPAHRCSVCIGCTNLSMLVKSIGEARGMASICEALLSIVT